MQELGIKSVEYKLWGIPIIKYTYEIEVMKKPSVDATGVPKSVLESL